MKDILKGVGVEDPQIKCNPPGTVGNGSGFPGKWNPPDPEENQDIITIGDDAGIRITHGNPVLIEALEAPVGQCGSKHWVGKGDAGSDWESEVLMRLTGKSYATPPDKEIRLGGRFSYAMSNLVNPLQVRPGQLVLLEYDEEFVAMVKAGGSGIHDLPDYIAARHQGKVNIATADGSVRAVKKDWLIEQYDQYYYNPGYALVLGSHNM